MITSPPKRGMALVVVLVLLAVMMLVTITLSGRMQQQLGRTRSQQEYQQALWYSASAESLALSALSLSLKNEKRVHLEQPWASGPRFFPLPQGQIAVTLRDAQACFNLNALAQPTTASRPLAVQQLIALITRLDVPAYRAELIAESLWEFIDEDRSVQTRLGREDSEYLARSVPFYAANQPLADISEMRVVQGMDAGLYQKLKPLVCALPMTRQQININTLDVTQSVILEALFDPWLSPVQARALLQQRPAKGWEDVDQFLAQPLLADVDEEGFTGNQLILVVQIQHPEFFTLQSRHVQNQPFPCRTGGGEGHAGFMKMAVQGFQGPLNEAALAGRHLSGQKGKLLHCTSLHSVDDAHNGAAFRMLQGVIPQPVIMDRHGITLRTTGMMTVRHQTGSNAGSFRAHFSAVTVHGIEQYPCFVIIVIRFGCHKCPAVVQGVQIPDTTAVVFTQTVHPAEDTGLQGHPLWNEAKVLRPEADALFIRDYGGNQLRLVIP